LLYEPLISATRAICPAHLKVLDLTALILITEVYKQWNPSVAIVHSLELLSHSKVKHSPEHNGVTCPNDVLPLGQNILFSHN
jgi:hypothetical protein